jgi:hypothetical protein
MHADEIDNAAELEAFNLQLALANRPNPTMRFTGSCYYCEEKIEKGHFCSHECREDSEKIIRANLYRRG